MIMGETLNVNVREKRIVYKSNTFGFIDNFHLDSNIATLGAKSKLKAEQNKKGRL